MLKEAENFWNAVAQKLELPEFEKLAIWHQGVVLQAVQMLDQVAMECCDD